MVGVNNVSRLSILVGTRPEFVKIASIASELTRRDVDFSLILSGQHYDDRLSKIFLKELNLPKADFNLGVGSGTPGLQTANVMIKLERVFRKSHFMILVVQGDTNTALAGAISARKSGMQLAHVEAGLRSYDLRMPEEHNRRIADHLSQYLFAPTNNARATLKSESCDGIVYVSGNTVIDACITYGPKAKRLSNVLNELPFQSFALATTHRAENVDDPQVLKQFVQLFCMSPIPIVYPLHPRTKSRLADAGLLKRLASSKNVCIIPPTGYLDFLCLLMNCEFVLTDSGGIQEEVTAPNIRKKAFVLRQSTERPEAVSAGYAEVVGTQSKSIIRRLNSFLDSKWARRVPSPYGDGHAGRRIAKVLEDVLN